MERWIIFLVIFPLEITLSMALSCDVAYSKAAYDFYTRKTRYTCVDMQYIQHGQGCYRKCNSITSYYNLLGYRTCTEGICPVRIARRSTYISPNQCAREATATECDPLYPYRSLDGHCNNLMYPDWGKSETLQTRLLPSAYDDGRGSPRTRGTHGTLPNARQISNIVHKAGSAMKTERKLSYMVMQIGQFVAHDFVLSKLRAKPNGDPLDCCGEDKNTSGCNPIQIPMNDPHFKPGGCMDFARTNSSYDCNGILQQFNSQTSYLDLSMLYGSSDKELAGIRTFERGKMSTVNNKLPVDYGDTTCDLSKPINVPHYYCGHSGDPRVHENPGLASMHTILLREHNRLAEGLAHINPHWGDERLFQEARKINIAQWQNIIYQEYLPILVGQYWRRKFKLNIKSSGYKDTYNHHVDASITNAFAVAAFRFGHSMVHRHISMLGYAHENMMHPEPLDSNYFDANLYHANNSQGLEYLLLWISATKCPMLDAEMEESVQTLLFKDAAQLSFDLAALNIQRGRDHGIPSYNAYRALCGLSNVEHFGTSHGGLVDHHADVAFLLQQAYSHPDDIDLFTGLVSERRGKWGILGPTGQCIVAIQFKRLRDGDRFFFERRDPWNPSIGFTAAQLNAIKKVKLSTLFCSNMEATQVQRNLFLQPTTPDSWRHDRGMVPCTTIRECEVDLNMWRSFM